MATNSGDEWRSRRANPDAYGAHRSGYSSLGRNTPTARGTGTPRSEASYSKYLDLELSPPDSGDDSGVMHHNIELRRRLEEEHASYKRKLQTYQEAQQRQGELVQKLQNKILQYKKKIGDLERQVMEGKQNLAAQKAASTRKGEDAAEIEGLHQRLEDEQQKNSSLSHVNAILREQLEEATEANQSLNIELGRLTDDLNRNRMDTERRDADWKREQKTFNDYFSAEHSRLLVLWRSVLAFRRQFSELKTQTDRELEKAKSETERVQRSVQAACVNLSANLKSTDSQLKADSERERQEFKEKERQLQEKMTKNEEKMAKQKKNLEELQLKLDEMKKAKDKLQDRLNERDRAINKLNMLRGVDTSSIGSDAGDSSADHDTRSLVEDTERIHRTLRDITELVGKEEYISESGDSPLSIDISSPRSPITPVHTSQQMANPLSPSGRGGRPGAGLPANFAFASVQSLLQKRNAQMTALKVKLSGANDTNQSLQKKLEAIESEKKQVDRSLVTSKDEADSLRKENEDLHRDRDRLRSTLDLTDSEKSQLEALKASLKDQMTSLREEIEKLQKSNLDLSKERDTIDNQNDDLKRDVERLNREIERLKHTVEGLEEKASKFKENLASSKEALNRVTMERDVLKREKGELDGSSRGLLDANSALEQELAKRRADEVALREDLGKLESIHESVLQDKANLKKMIQQYESEKSILCADKLALEQEKAGIREELIHIEQEKMDLDAEKASLTQTLQMAERASEQMEAQLTALCRERTDLTEQLNSANRQLGQAKEDATSNQRETERVTAQLARVSRERDDLAAMKNTLSAQVGSWEEQNEVAGDQMRQLKEEKEACETSLFEAQQMIGQLESSKEALLHQVGELTARREEMQNNIARQRREYEVECGKLNHQRDLLQAKLTDTERSLRVALDQARGTHASEVSKLIEERDAREADIAEKLAEIEAKHNREREEATLRWDREREDLESELAATQRDLETRILASERGKQEALVGAAGEASILRDKIARLEEEVSSERQNVERARGEAQVRREADKGALDAANAEIKNLKQRLELSTSSIEKTTKNANQTREELTKERDQLMRQVGDNKLQMQLAEEMKDGLKKELADANHALKMGEEEREVQRRQIQELKRHIAEGQREIEAIDRSNEELREKIKEVEAEKVELARNVKDLKQKLALLDDHKTILAKESTELRSNVQELDRSKSDVRKELHETKRRAKAAESDRARLEGEVEELRNRVMRDEEKADEARKQNYALKQRLVEMEAAREGVQKDLTVCQKRIGELDEELRSRDRELTNQQEQDRSTKRKLNETRSQLELQLDSANQETARLKSQVGQLEQKRTANENALANSEFHRREAEGKLGAILSSLRRLIGFQTGSSGMLGRQTPSMNRLFSNSRAGSPTKGMDSFNSRPTSPIRSKSRARSPTGSIASSVADLSSASALDVDPEAVRVALRAFVQQLVTAERERDDAVAQLKSLEARLAEQGELLGLNEHRLHQLQQAFFEAEEEKKNLDGQLRSTSSALMQTEENLRQSDQDRKAMHEKNNKLEKKLAAATNDNKQLQDQVACLKDDSTRHQEDKRGQKRTLEDIEARATQLEVAKCSIEGDLKRVQNLLNEKKAEFKALQEKMEAANKNNNTLDTKCHSLEVSVDRLTQALARQEEENAACREKISKLTSSVEDHALANQKLQDQLAKLQHATTTADHSTRILQERFENTRTALSEQKMQNRSLSERLEALRAQVAEEELRRTELEGLHQQSSGLLMQREQSRQELVALVQSLTSEKTALQEKNASLQRALNDSEADYGDLMKERQRLEKDKSTLKKTVSKLERDRSRTQDVSSKTTQEKSELEMTNHRLEMENAELLKQLKDLESQLGDTEQRHAQRLVEVASRQRADTDGELDRLRSMHQQAESRERTMRQRIKSLEEELSSLQSERTRELRSRSRLLVKSPGLHAGLSSSTHDLRHLLESKHLYGGSQHHLDLDPAVLEADARNNSYRSNYRNGGGSIGSPAMRGSPAPGFRH